MKFLNWLVLNDGVGERVTEDMIDSMEEAAVIDRCLLPVSRGEPGRAGGRQGPYSVRGEISGKRALLRLYDEDAPLADIAVCLHSRAASGLWAALLPLDPDVLLDVECPRNAPWCAVIYYAPEMALPAWFDSWTKTIGMALLKREGW